MTAASPSQEGSESADTESPALTPAEDGQDDVTADDLKAKFREALARKRSMQAEAAALAANSDAPKIHGAHGPAASQRSFRRKSGG